MSRPVGAPLATTAWTLTLAAALLWPGRALSIVDGMPLDGRAEAVLIGVAVPALWWAHRGFLARPLARILIVALLAIKIAGALLLTQQGLCARFSTAAPYNTRVVTIPIEEPRGFLRSWDVRADLRADAPACTAIVDRPYGEASAFPAWFANITDSGSGVAYEMARARPAPPPITMDVTGAARVTERGQFSIELGRDMAASGRIGSQAVSSTDGRTMEASLDSGVHAISLHVAFAGDRRKFVPRWNGSDAFRSAALTVREPNGRDRWLAFVLAWTTVGLVVVLAGWWTLSFLFAERASPLAIAWCLTASAILAVAGVYGRFERLTGVFLLASVAVPVAAPQRNLRGAFLLLGVPWLAFFVARSLPQVGHFSVYSIDDWLAYQVAGYRIFMNGFWLEGGNHAFDYQPLYRWITGLLHLVFGDSSVGEVYWDAACLLMGALLCFSLVKGLAGFRVAIAASATVLAIFTLGTVWYFLGRGLSEIAAAGWSFLAAAFLLRARLGRRRAALGAGLFSVLMFYTRLNHALFAGFLLALLLPTRLPARWQEAARAVRHARLGPAVVYGVTFAAGVALFALRTWWYTGVFSVLYGTSLRNNDTGLRLTTLASGEVWSRVSHSLRALVWMNEPPAPDVRAGVVALGVVLSAVALLQLPRLRQLPLAIAVVTLGATASSFFAHTHAYPGRMSIHLVPFAVAMTACAAARLSGLWIGAAADSERRTEISAG